MIYCGDCLDVISKLPHVYGLIITSPPYNIGKNTSKNKNARSNARANYDFRYDTELNPMTADEYADWTVKVFNALDKVLDKDGVIIYNLSYGVDIKNDIGSTWITIAEIIRRTNFTVADKIAWKKKTALPCNTSANKLTRIVEDVFVFCRKDEYQTFNSAKEIKSVSKTGQKFYTCLYNFIEAKNNDGRNPLNKATYSVELVKNLLDMYYLEGRVLDPFGGSGTTELACKERYIDCDSVEISEEQCEYARQRLGYERFKYGNII